MTRSSAPHSRCSSLGLRNLTVAEIAEASLNVEVQQLRARIAATNRVLNDRDLAARLGASKFYERHQQIRRERAARRKQ